MLDRANFLTVELDRDIEKHFPEQSEMERKAYS
jgi:hypothetical protein